MPGITVRVHGTDRLRRNLAKLQGARRDAATQAALAEGAHVVEIYAKELVPYRTGALHNSIMVDDLTPDMAAVAAHVDYANHVEFGTVRMAARPYLRPALIEHQGEVLDAIGNVLEAFAEGAAG